MTRHATHDPTLLPLTPIATNFAASNPHPSNSAPTSALYPPRHPDPVHPSPILTEPPTPTSTATIRTLTASPSPNDDHNSLPMSITRNTRTRSSSRIYRWIEDQQHFTTAVNVEQVQLGDALHPVALPYLAYPQMSVASLIKNPREEVARVEGYVFVDGGGTQPTERALRGDDAHVTQYTGTRPETPSSPSTPRKSRASVQGVFHAPSPLRNLHLSFAARRPSPSTSGAQRASSSASLSSTFRHNPERTASHSRGSSLSTVNAIQRGARPVVPELTATPPKTTAWKFKRPSVAGHFTPSPPEEESESRSPPPRPSTSSSVTQSGSSTAYTTSTTTTTARTSCDAPPRKMYFGSIRSQSSTTIFSSSPSLWSLPTDASHINDPPESTKVIARDRDLSPLEGISPMTWKPASATNLATVTNLLTSPRSRKKRKLIISGIPPHDERRFEAVRKWCESFGELNSITRVPNGDLHVDFRKVEVADTVCRLNARVYIAGVGSVCLSWFTGKRP